jgi:hypothetical protein
MTVEVGLEIMLNTPNQHRALFSIVVLLCGFLGFGTAASASSVPSDFDGDGKTDIAMFHRGSGTPGLAYWNFLKSSNSIPKASNLA